MNIVWGLVVLALALLAWGGQTISWLAPDTAQALSLMEREEDVEPTYWADIRGEAAWDFFTLWILAVAGLLLAVDAAAWPYFGMIGGAVYVYFAGRGILTRLAMQRRGLKIGALRNVKLGYGLLVAWGLMGFGVVVAAVMELNS
jgi:hypothetical protein